MIERLAIVGGEDSGFGNDDTPSSDVPHSQKQSDPQPFLPRLAHLHALPALAVRLLEHIAATSFCAPAPTPSRSSTSMTPPRIYETRYAYLCGFYSTAAMPHHHCFTCGTKDFLATFYYISVF
jgi:hypothetical protein